MTSEYTKLHRIIHPEYEEIWEVRGKTERISGAGRDISAYCMKCRSRRI